MIALSLMPGEYDLESLCEENDAVEIRLDAAGWEIEKIGLLMAKRRNIILKFPESHSAGLDGLFLKAIEYNVFYVDIPWDDAVYPASIFRSERRGEKNTGVIRSFHDYSSFIETAELRNIYKKAMEYGADIVKLAVRPANAAQARELVALQMELEDAVVIGMGEAGRVTRIAGLTLGAKIIYAGMRGNLTANGQYDVEKMKRLRDALQ